jgi:hypothetical protein
MAPSPTPKSQANSVLAQNISGPSNHVGGSGEINVSAQSQSVYQGHNFGNYANYDPTSRNRDDSGFVLYPPAGYVGGPYRLIPTQSFAPVRPQYGSERISSRDLQHNPVAQMHGHGGVRSGLHHGTAHADDPSLRAQGELGKTLLQQHPGDPAADPQRTLYDPFSGVFNARVNVQADLRPNQWLNAYGQPNPLAYAFPVTLEPQHPNAFISPQPPISLKNRQLMATHDDDA